jgi:hypothetical protein
MRAGKIIGPLTRPVYSNKFIGPRMRPNGFGESKTYSVPSSKQTVTSVGAPQFNGGKAIHVRHREYLQPILEVSTYTGAGRYIIQPGLSDNFPWLAQIAGSFENYKFLMCRYVYRNRVGTNSNASIYLSTQYDVNDPEFKSIDEAMNYAGSRDEVVWRDWSYDVRPKAGQLTKKYMVRTDTLPSGLDPTTYDTALFTICAVGGSPGAYVGDLYVEYEVAFSNPKLNPNLLGAVGAWNVGTGANLSAFVAAPWANMDPTFTSISADQKGFNPNNLPVLATAGATPSITFPVPGAYSVRYNVSDPGSTATLTGGGFTNVDGLSEMDNIYSSYASAAGKGMQNFCDVITHSPGAKIVLSAITGTGTSAGTVVGTLQIVCESLNYMLSKLGDNPNPPLTLERFNKLKIAFKNHDLSRWERRLERAERERMLSDMLQDRWDRKGRESRRMEVELEPEAENSEGEVVEVPQARSRSIDKRSKSSERKERQL